MSTSVLPIEVHHHHTAIESPSSAQISSSVIVNNPGNLVSLRNDLITSLHLPPTTTLDLVPNLPQAITAEKAQEMGFKIVLNRSSSKTITELVNDLSEMKIRLSQVEVELKESKRFEKKVGVVPTKLNLRVLLARYHQTFLLEDPSAPADRSEFLQGLHLSPDTRRYFRRFYDEQENAALSKSSHVTTVQAVAETILDLPKEGRGAYTEIFVKLLKAFPEDSTDNQQELSDWRDTSG